MVLPPACENVKFHREMYRGSLSHQVLTRCDAKCKKPGSRVSNLGYAQGFSIFRKQDNVGTLMDRYG